MRFFLWSLLFKKIRKDAVNSGINPFIIYLICSALMSVMGGIGYMVGLNLGGPYIGLICAAALAILGYYISHVIANHSFVDYTPRKNSMPMRQDSYVSGEYFVPWAHVQLIHAQITIAPESSGCVPPAVWEIFLNGRKAGELKDGSRITFPTGNKSNVLVARGPGGALSPPFEFSVKSGRHLEVLFSEGRFEETKDIGKMTFNRPARPSGARHAAQ